MGWLKKIVAWIAHKLSKEQKAELFDKAVDKWAGKEVVSPHRQIIPEDKFIDRGPSDRIEKRKQKEPKKKGK